MISNNAIRFIFTFINIFRNYWNEDDNTNLLNFFDGKERKWKQIRTKFMKPPKELIVLALKSSNALMSFFGLFKAKNALFSFQGTSGI